MSTRSSGNVVLLLGLTLLLVSCEEDVVAVLGTDESYTLWGVLNPLADTQFVRVFPIEGTLNPGTPGPLDARFLSKDLNTGEERRWRDSVIVDDRGIVGHVFYAPFRVEYRHTYHLEITGAAGASSAAEVEVPVRTNLSIEEPDTTIQGVLLPVYIPNNPPRLIKNELTFDIGYVRGFSASGCPLYSFYRYVLPYDDRIRRTEDGWWFIVNLGELYHFAEFLAEDDPYFVSQLGITLAFLRFDTIIANEAWNPPNGILDADILVQPGTMSNVEHGFGFVGAGYRLARTWTLLARVIEKSGFRANYAMC